MYRRPPIYKQGTAIPSLPSFIPLNPQTTCSSAGLRNANYCTFRPLLLLPLHTVDVDFDMVLFSVERAFEKESFQG